MSYVMGRSEDRENAQLVGEDGAKVAEPGGWTKTDVDDGLQAQRDAYDAGLVDGRAEATPLIAALLILSGGKVSVPQRLLAEMDARTTVHRSFDMDSLVTTLEVSPPQRWPRD